MRNGRWTLCVVFALILLAGAGGDVRGQEAGPFSVTPSLGWYVFDGDQDLKDRPAYGVGFGYDLDKTWSAEAILNYVDTKSEAGAGDAGAYLLRLEGLYHFLTSRYFSPYFAAGLGGIRLDPDQGGSDTDFLVDYGLGAKYFLKDNLALRGDVRHIISFDDTENNFLFGVGLTFFFGGKKETVVAAPKELAVVETRAEAPKDADGDGVYDKDDQCPNTPRGVAVDASGCPLDTDGDGVPDYLDQCPATPAGVKVDDEGCPIDTDGDGVPDHLDKCPDTPKGLVVDPSGCPLDTDGDGVYDYLDKCPGTPKGVVVDSQGCPLDTDKDGVFDYLDKCHGTPKGARVNDVGCWILPNVEFDTAKWDIKAQYHPILDEAVDVMNRSSDLRIEIQGHTDNRGSKKYNQGLSERRANAVMQYFLKKGISKERLTAKGYGLSDPVASNDTDAGRAKNRRVQLNPF